MLLRPDEDNDVICHQFRLRDGRDTWTIWLGRHKQGDRDTLNGAIELACDVAAIHSRPAWMLDETGYPLKPLEWGAPH